VITIHCPRCGTGVEVSAPEVCAVEIEYSTTSVGGRLVAYYSDSRAPHKCEEAA
jgi:hypothetical protein